MSFCRPPATVKSACAASHSPMLLRPHFSTGSASPYPSACASPITSCQHLLQAPDCQKCSDDFLAKVLICLDPTVDSAQVGLGPAGAARKLIDRLDIARVDGVLDPIVLRFEGEVLVG